MINLLFIAVQSEEYNKEQLINSGNELISKANELVVKLRRFGLLEEAIKVEMIELEVVELVAEVKAMRADTHLEEFQLRQLESQLNVKSAALNAIIQFFEQHNNNNVSANSSSKSITKLQMTKVI